jgi:hypothetical protein
MIEAQKMEAFEPHRTMWHGFLSMNYKIFRL